MNSSTLAKANEYLQALDIELEILEGALDLSPLEMKYMTKACLQWREDTERMIRQDSLTAADLRELIGCTLTYWNACISVSGERYWQRLKKASIGYQRKDPIRFVLKHRRFPNVGAAQDARYNWTDLVDSGLLKDRYPDRELTLVARLIHDDESARLQLLRDCLRKGKLPGSQYLRFGASIAYFTRNRLLDNRAYKGTLLSVHFREEEIVELDRIWSAAS